MQPKKNPMVSKGITQGSYPKVPLLGVTIKGTIRGTIRGLLFVGLLCLLFVLMSCGICYMHAMQMQWA